MPSIKYTNKYLQVLLISAFCTLFFFTFSCGRKWKKSTVVSFKFEINKDTSTSGHLVFDGGYIIVEQINFLGGRKQGKDVDIAYNINSKADFATGLTIPLINMDIPQGTYKKIDIDIKVNKKDTEPAILLIGAYINDSLQSIPLRFEFNSGITFEIEPKSKDGSNEIVLIEDIPATSTIIFDPVYWFDTVTKAILDSAAKEDINGIPTILISINNNDNIFSLIVPRLDEGVGGGN